jgi:tetratricopeptide (TPR) repeat protein
MNAMFEGRAVRCLWCCLGLVLLLVPLAAYSQPQEQANPALQVTDPAIAQKLSSAYDCHELALLYIRKGEPEKAAAEVRRMIELRIPPPFDRSVAESVSIVTDKLAEVGRYDMGQNLLDEALKAATEIANQVRLLRTKARLFKLAGDDDRAIQSWQKALELESRRNP